MMIITISLNSFALETNLFVEAQGFFVEPNELDRNAMKVQVTKGIVKEQGNGFCAVSLPAGCLFSKNMMLRSVVRQGGNMRNKPASPII
jgi:hypothetical protein